MPRRRRPLCLSQPGAFWWSMPAVSTTLGGQATPGGCLSPTTSEPAGCPRYVSRTGGVGNTWHASGGRPARGSSRTGALASAAVWPRPSRRRPMWWDGAPRRPSPWTLRRASPAMSCAGCGTRAAPSGSGTAGVAGRGTASAAGSSRPSSRDRQPTRPAAVHGAKPRRIAAAARLPPSRSLGGCCGSRRARRQRGRPPQCSRGLGHAGTWNSCAKKCSSGCASIRCAGHTAPGWTRQDEPCAWRGPCPKARRRCAARC